MTVPCMVCVSVLLTCSMFIYLCVCLFVYVCAQACVYVCVCICLCVHMSLCVHMAGGRGKANMPVGSNRVLKEPTVYETNFC